MTRDDAVHEVLDVVHRIVHKQPQADRGDPQKALVEAYRRLEAVESEKPLEQEYGKPSMRIS